MATFFGVALALTPTSFVAGIGIFAIILFAFSYVSFASISFSIALPILTIIFAKNDWTIFFFALFAGIVIILTHRSNIQRLLKKQESKFRFRKKTTE